MIPVLVGPAPVSPVSSAHQQYRYDDAARAAAWAGGGDDNNNINTGNVPAFLGVDLNADASSCSSISHYDDGDDDDDDDSMMTMAEDHLGHDHELDCLISFDDAAHDDRFRQRHRHHNPGVTNGVAAGTATTEIFTPYPFDRQTKEEIENFRQLGLSFGEDWSLRFAAVDADEVTCSEAMSICGGGSATLADDGWALAPTVGPHLGGPDGNDASTWGIMDESDEVKAMRNRLWKQSLKTSMFTGPQSCQR